METLEEMEELYQDKEIIRILSLDRLEAIDELYYVSQLCTIDGEYRRSFELLRCALQLLQTGTRIWTDKYTRLLESLDWSCANAIHRSQFKLDFYDVFEILDMMTSKVLSTGRVNKFINLHRMDLILSFLHHVNKQDKSPDQEVSFKRVVRRLVRSGLRIKDSQTSFLHRAIERCCSSQSCLNVVEVLLECGADVNAVDRRNNTPLHLCARPYSSEHFDQNQQDQVMKLLLRYSAHVDIVNESGDMAAKGLPLNILDYVNLKCLAAAVIRDRRIPYVGEIPASLELFVRMHGRCPK